MDGWRSDVGFDRDGVPRGRRTGRTILDKSKNVGVLKSKSSPGVQRNGFGLSQGIRWRKNIFGNDEVPSMVNRQSRKRGGVRQWISEVFLDETGSL